MKYLRWSAIVLLSVFLAVVFAEVVGKFLGISSEVAMGIICLIIFPIFNFFFDIIRLEKLDNTPKR